MGTLIYATNTSLDGFTEDASGSFDWSVPDEDVHEFHNDMMGGIGTQLLGRRMYETMAVWESEPSLADESAVLADFAGAWQDSDKFVYSTTLTNPMTKRMRIVPAFEADEVRAMKAASSADLLVGGPGLAAHALRAGVVDEVRLVLSPVAVGAGKPAFPTDLRLDFELIDERRFATAQCRWRIACDADSGRWEAAGGGERGVQPVEVLGGELLERHPADARDHVQVDVASVGVERRRAELAHLPR